MRHSFIKELKKLAQKDPDVFLITGDLGFGVFDEFIDTYPNQFLNAGVAEQNMTMVAAGMALQGKKVYTYSIGNFPTLRCLEQIRNDICYHDLNVTIVSIGGGFSYGQLGMSHHATEDISILRALPNLRVVVPGTLNEVIGATNELYNLKGPSYLRLDKSSAEDQGNVSSYNIGKANLIREGSDVTLVTCGGILKEVISAAVELEKKSIKCRVLSMHTIKPFDFSSIEKASKETGGIISIEENNIIGGLGSCIAEFCLESNNIPKFFKRIALEDVYSSIVGDQEYLRGYYGLNKDRIITEVLNLI